jgi:hypothetical protein
MPDSDDQKSGGTPVVRFPQSRVRLPGSGEPVKELGTSPLAAMLGAPVEQTTGHWCSRCQGIWFGYPLEVTCPVCGNRHG